MNIQARVNPSVTRVDGTALTVEEILRIKVFLSLNGTDYVEIDPIQPPFATKILIQNSQDGVNYLFRFSCVTTDGIGGEIESDLTDPVSPTKPQVRLAKPNIPTLVDLVYV